MERRAGFFHQEDDENRPRNRCIKDIACGPKGANCEDE